MAHIPTETRIFVSRYIRELKQTLDHETVMARLARAQGPVKKAAVVRQMATEATNVLAYQSTGNRAASLCHASFQAGRNPILGTGSEDGVCITEQTIKISRYETSLQSDRGLVFISRHALGRLHQRQPDLTPEAVTTLLGYVAVLSFLLQLNDKHVWGEMNLLVDGLLVTGSLKAALQRDGDGSDDVRLVYDIRTILPAEDMSAEKLEQGRAAAHQVASYLEDQTSNVDDIPYLPSREDHTSRTGIRAEYGN